MTDDYDNDELVSAYLDDEVTSDERARVESDPSLMAEVERLRGVQAAVAEVEAPHGDAKEAAITAALAVFDELEGEQTAAAAAGPGPGEVVVPMGRRHRHGWMQGLGAAAAAAVIVVGGIVIATRGGDDDTATQDRDVADITTSPMTTPAAVATSTTPSLAAGPPPTTAATADRDEGTDAPMAQLEATTAATEETDATFEGDAAASEAGGPPPAPATQPSATSPSDAALAPNAAQLEVLRTDDDLAGFVDDLAEPPPPIEDVIEACERDTGTTDAQYEDADGVLHPVAVARTDDGYAAVSLADCEIVLEATD